MLFRLTLLENKVPDAVSKPQSPFFEFGNGAVIGPFCVIRCRVNKCLLTSKHFQHLLGIFLPVCCAVKLPPSPDAGAKELHEIRLDQAALVVPGLVPGIREKDVNPVK